MKLPGGRNSEVGIRNAFAEKLLGISRSTVYISTVSTEKKHAGTYLGGMFSGLLDQSDTQSTLFFKASTSFSPSTTSSSDYKGEFKL